MKVCLVAAPLMARSGVYRSAHDLVASARAQGLEWNAILGMRESALHMPAIDSDFVTEMTVSSHGSGIVPEIAHTLMEHPVLADADVIITLISQSDLAVAKSSVLRRGKTWIAFVRGLPWPDAGEQSLIRRVLIKALETRALRAADDVWATTPVLASQISSAVAPHIVPAGIPELARGTVGLSSDGPLIWAGRLDGDKRPGFFVDICQDLGVQGEIIGDGPLRDEIESKISAMDLVDYLGWMAPQELWRQSSMYLGTSSREAFGRSAVEAARYGLPVILSTGYGAAPFLYTDPELFEQFVLPHDDLNAWRDAVSVLRSDQQLRMRVSEHVYNNAGKLTIEASVQAAMSRISEVRSS